MRNWIRDWLGINHLIDSHDELRNHSINLQADIRELTRRNNELRTSVAVRDRAIGRLIAKLDPMYGIPEDDPARKAASDKLGDEITAKLYAEHIASNKLTGEHG